MKGQGIDRTPQIHLSPVAAAIEKRTGKKTWRGDQWRAHNDIIKAEAELAAAATEIAKISAIAQPPFLPLESKPPTSQMIKTPAQKKAISTPDPKVEAALHATATALDDELLKLIELAESERKKAREKHREKEAAFVAARALYDLNSSIF